MMLDARGGDRERLDNFYNHIAQLTVVALTGEPKRQRKAYKDLTREITASSHFDPVFIVLEKGLDICMNEENPIKLKRQLDTLSEVLASACGDAEDRGGKNARLNQTVATTLSSIVARDREISESNQYTFLRKEIQNNPKVDAAYQTVMDVTKYVDGRAKQGATNTRVSFYTDPDEGPLVRARRQREQRTHGDWWYLFKDHLSGYVQKLGDLRLKDALFEDLRNEPALGLPKAGEEPFVNRKFAGLRFADIERMQYPLSNDDVLKLMDYLTEIFAEKDSGHDWWRRGNDWVIPAILLTSVIFTDENGDVLRSDNFHLHANLTDFQEKLLWLLLYEEKPEGMGELKRLLEVIPDSAVRFLINSLVRYTLRAEVHDHRLGEISEAEIQEQHPFSRSAAAWKAQQPRIGWWIYSDEAGYDYMLQVILPLLRQRARNFGVVSKFDSVITLFEQDLSEFSFEKDHLNFIKKIFLQNCGEEFLERLDAKAADIQEITRIAWEAFEAEGIHFLPMMIGFNTITFTENSIPDIMGLESITFNTTGDLRDWKINIKFQLRNSTVPLVGMLEDQGMLRLKAPVEKELPGLYLLLNHIAVLAFKDLTAQTKRRAPQTFITEGKIYATGKATEETMEVEARTKDTRRGKSKRKTSRSLPRVQSDKQLIEEVSRGGSFTPRPVELHPSWVRGGKEYFTAIQLYHEALENEYPEDTIQWLLQELEVARESSFKASERKIGTMPKRFENKRVQVIDPVTEEKRDLVTWVVEHVSPKPANREEAESPVLMYQRYYSRSSSLASLEQLKPWFIGLSS